MYKAGSVQAGDDSASCPSDSLSSSFALLMHFQTSLHLITKSKMSSSGTQSASSSSSELSLHRCHSSSSSHTSYSSNASQASTSSSASGHSINFNLNLNLILKQKLHEWFRSTHRIKVPKIVIHPPDVHDVFVKPSIPTQDWRPVDDEETMTFGVPERDGRGRLYGSDEGVWFPNGL